MAVLSLLILEGAISVYVLRYLDGFYKSAVLFFSYMIWILCFLVEYYDFELDLIGLIVFNLAAGPVCVVSAQLFARWRGGR